ILRGRGDLVGAEAEFRRAVELKPDRAEPHNGLGNVLRDRGDNAGAEAEYRRAVELEPDHADTHYNLGVLLGGRGDNAGPEASSSSSPKTARPIAAWD